MAMAENEELPPWHGTVQTLCAVMAVLSIIALLSKANLECTMSRQASLLFFVCIKSYTYWITLLVGALGWGMLTWAANMPATKQEKEDDMIVVTPTVAPAEPAEPPKLEFPTNRRAKNIDDRCQEIADALETFSPKPRERHGEFPDQTYDYLKSKLPKKYWIIGQFKRKGNRGPHIVVDREIGIDLIDCTDNNLKALHRRIDNLSVEYKKIVLVLWDHGKVAGSVIDSNTKEYLSNNAELKAVVVIRV